MAIRDDEAAQKFRVRFCSNVEQVNAIQAKLESALASPTIKTPDAYTVDFDEFLSSGNAPFSYGEKSYNADWLPLTPADELLHSAHPIHAGKVEWDSAKLENISYNHKLNELGISHAKWTADVLEPMRAITKEALQARVQFAAMLRASPATRWVIKTTQCMNSYVVCLSNHVGLGAEEKDRSTIFDYFVCLSLIPFRIISANVCIPFGLLGFLFSSFLGLLLDFLTCHTCRYGTAARLEAVTNLLKSSPSLDQKRLAEKVQADLASLANNLNSAYGNSLRFEVVLTAEFGWGEYNETFMPAHAVPHQLSLVCAIITSVELFLGIQSGMERQREFYLMAVDLYSALSLERHHRTVNGKRYLEKILSQYNKLIENSDVVRAKITDHLLPVIPNAEDPEIIISAGSLDKNLGANI